MADVATTASLSAPIHHPSHTHIPGEVVVMGQGDVGQLGLGEEVMERKKPFPVGGALEGKNVVQVLCGGMHTVALTDEGKVCHGGSIYQVSQLSPWTINQRYMYTHFNTYMQHKVHMCMQRKYCSIIALN